LLSIDAVSGKEFIKLSKTAKADDLVEYFYSLCVDLYIDGYKKLTVILDNNQTHKDKMRYNLWQYLKSNTTINDFQIRYINIAPYSPDYNLAEYAIHQIRLKILHHCSEKMNIEERESAILNYLSKYHIFNSGVSNIINHILSI
jgi:transposase